MPAYQNQRRQADGLLAAEVGWHQEEGPTGNRFVFLVLKLKLHSSQMPAYQNQAERLALTTKFQANLNNLTAERAASSSISHHHQSPPRVNI